MRKQIVVVLSAALFSLAAGRLTAADDVQDWWLLQEIRVLPASVPSAEWHRLASATNAMQLVRRPGDGQPVTFARIPQSGGSPPNVRIRRLVDDASFESPRDTGRNVLLNEPVALYFNGAGYLVYRKGASGLGLEWQRESHFSPARSDRDVYQWEFQVARDRRSREILTKEHVALRNSLRGAYLRTTPNGNRLGWHRD
jgi:hypothetical protein